MKVINYLPKFDGQVSSIKKDAETELFQKLYNEKSASMDHVKVLNFYGAPGTGKTWLMKTLYRKLRNYKTSKDKPVSPAPSKTELPVALYCKVFGGISTVISQIIKQASKEYGFTFPLTSVCLYILSRTEEEEAERAFPLPDLQEVANYIGKEPEFQYLKQMLDTEPLGENSFTHLYIRLVLDDQAPSSLRQLAETNTGMLENLFTWSAPQFDPAHRSFYHRHSELFASREMERQQKNRTDYLSAFFTSFFAADMESNLQAYREPAVIFLDGIENIFSYSYSANAMKEKEKWLCGTTGLLATVPNVFWVLSSDKKLHWEKDYLPDWNDALTQKAITVHKGEKSNTPARFSAAIWKQINTLDKKVQCVLQGLGIFNYDLAFKACTALIEEYQDIPGFEEKCRSSIIKYLKNANNNLSSSYTQIYLPSNRLKHFYCCYEPETPPNSKELLKYKFKAFYFARQYYTALINRIRLDTVNFKESFHPGEQTWDQQLAGQIRTLEELIANTENLITDNNCTPQRLRDFYFATILPQVLDWTDLGLYILAERILEKLKTVTTANGNLFAAVYELGYAYLQKVRDNNNAAAVKRIEQIYEANVALAGKDDPISVYILNILGYVRSYLPGQELAAYRERRKCALILKNVLGRSAKSTLRITAMLRPHLTDIGRSKAAATLSKICFTYATNLYGDSDLTSLKCKSQYAFYLKANERNREAAELQESVANGYEKAYGKYSPDTLSIWKSLANTLYALSKEEQYDDEDGTVRNDSEAKEKELRLRENILNRYTTILQHETIDNDETVHPMIREAVINVCDSMHNCGRPLEEILRFAIDHLGEKDPGIITVLNNAAIDDSDNGENDRAITTIKQAIELCKKQGTETYKDLKEYLTCQLSLAWFISQNGASAREESLALYKSIIKDCETLMAIAEKENSDELNAESKLFAASRFYKIAQYANYYFDENEFALEMVEKAIELKQSVSIVEDDELGKYLELKEMIEGEMG